MPGSLLGIRDLPIPTGRESGGSGGSRSDAPWEAIKRATMTTPARALSLVYVCACWTHRPRCPRAIVIARRKSNAGACDWSLGNSVPTLIHADR